MAKIQRFSLSRQQGFTLMEIIVATAIFVTVVTAVLALFDYVLQVNRRVQAVRQVAQGTRAFTETLSREIRNGRIDYTQATGNCAASNYTQASNQSLAMSTADGTQVCIYLVDGSSEGAEGSGQLYIERRNQGGTVAEELVNPPNFNINPDTFRFIVRPSLNPFGGSSQGIQPMVTILAEFMVYPGQRDEQIIPYQTTISSDVHNIPPL